jgi:hypothetical protein
MFDESALHQSQCFLTLWQRDYPLEQLAARRRKARFGWVNQEMPTNYIEQKR